MDENRRFLLKIIEAGLECDMLSPEELFEQVTPDILAHHLPVEVKARLLAACLNAKSIDEMLLLEVLGVEGLAEHAPVPLLWRAIEEAAVRSLDVSSGMQPSVTSAQTRTAPRPPEATRPLGTAPGAAAAASAKSGNRRAKTVPASRTAPSAVAPVPMPHDEFGTDTRRDNRSSSAPPPAARRVPTLEDTPAGPVSEFDDAEDNEDTPIGRFEDPHMLETAIGSGSRLEQLARQDEGDWGDGDETKPGA